MLPGEVNLSLHRKGLSKIKLSKIIIKKIINLFLTWMIVSIVLGADGKKQKEKKKRSSV